MALPREHAYSSDAVSRHDPICDLTKWLPWEAGAGLATGAQPARR